MFSLTCPAARSADEVSYLRDVQPIIAEHCLQCHGGDEAQRASGLRLDQREAALKGGDSGSSAFVPGDATASELVRRVKSADPDVLMPPPHLNKPLDPDQIETLERWIATGAKYESHWAFTAPAKAALPDAGQGNPVDAFVEERLRDEHLNLSAPAADNVLCRRLYLDIIGLPPTPDELSAFQADGLKATMENLLASPRYGEKWARHWLDLARYSDTNGYEKDLRRDQWSWRDWVITALNEDMPYDEFVIQQIAGDLLPGAGQPELIATGFLRNSMINEEGAIVPEQFRMVEQFDRMDCIGKAVLGLSVQCAQCHTHKFDPISHDEYFGLFAFINNTYEAQSWVYTPEQLEQRRVTLAKIDQLLRDAEAGRHSHSEERRIWESTMVASLADWRPLEMIEMGSISGLNHPTQEADKSLLLKGHTSADVFVIATPELNGVTGLQLEALTHHDLPHNGPGRSENGTWILHDVDVFVKAPDAADWEKLKLVNATADFSLPENKSADGKKTTGPVSLLVDGSDDTSWTADRGQGRRNQASVAVMQFETPLTRPPGTQLKIAWRNSDMIGCLRWSLTNSADPKAAAVDYSAVLAAMIPRDRRSPEQDLRLLEAWLRSLPEGQATIAEIDQLSASLPVAGTSILHLMERESSDPRTTHLLDRGNWDQPLHAVAPFTPAALHSISEADEPDRLKFAHWLVDPKSPLAARVAVNQMWQAIFGTGLVETSEDFGTRAPLPEYLDLLDWLAVDFMEHGWSRKHLLRTIVMSRVWQQSSDSPPELLTRDPRNRLLGRGARYRLDAEVVRDLALSVSGLVHHEFGGPAVIPPVPQNVLDYNYTYPSYWKPAEGAQRYRRSVYVFRKRSMPDPVMSAFDSPNADTSCARRLRSNTPLAALTGLNEPIFVEAARAFALRVLNEAEATDADRCRHAWLLCTSRAASDLETAELLALLAAQRKEIADGWLNPREILSGDPGKLPDLPEGSTPQDAAAWTLVARVLLNLDETITRN